MTAFMGRAPVSIIVRTKDRPELLLRNLRSIAAQDYRPIEVVLVNDGGRELDTDALGRVLGDVTLKYVLLSENVGRAAAANAGLRNAGGEFIGFLDDDDEFYSGHVGTLVQYLGGEGAHPAAYTDCVTVTLWVDGGGIVAGESTPFISEEFSYEKLLLGNYIPLMCLMFSRRVLKDVTFDTGFDLYEDWDMLMRLARKYAFHHIKKITAKYNRHQYEQITDDSTLYREAFIKLITKHMDEITPDVLFTNWDSTINMRAATLDLLEKIQGKSRDLELLDDSMRRKQLEIDGLDNQISEIHGTLGWQALEVFRGVRERLLRKGSRRRYWFDLAVKGVKVIMTQGVRVFFHKGMRKLRGTGEFDLSAFRRPGVPAEIPLKREPVDIVVPVYNAHDDLKACITSVLENTDLGLHRLVVIDDKSTDPRVRDYLGTLGEAEGEGIRVLFNGENLGFVKTVNRAMRLSDRDVVLLNSDTVVTSGWVEKLKRAASSNPRVATVTPFSNNATICSVPNFCEDNPLPEGFGIESFSEFIDRISLRYYPEIPTGVGFCMFIKRGVLEELDYFDEKAFDRGYGEENDFCMRALKKGYVHVLDDSTFVYHRGGASFTKGVKLTAEQKALNVIDTMHPEYLPLVDRFIRENPLSEIHSYINLRLSLWRLNRADKEADADVPGARG